MRLAILIILFPVILSAQIWKGSGIAYTSTSPTHEPGARGAWVVVDTLTGQWYEYDLTANIWREMGARLQATNTSGSPSYTPSKQRGRLAINSGDSLYYYQGGTWTHINAGGSVDLTPYVQYADSNLVFITPTTLDDSTAAIRADFPVVPTDTVSLMINDTIIGYFVNGGEVGRDTIRASGSGGGISGSGTTNYLTKWTGATVLGNALMRDNGAEVGIGVAPIVNIRAGIQGLGQTNLTTALRVTNSVGQISLDVNDMGHVGIGGPALGSPSYKLRVYGNIWADGFLQLSMLSGAGGVGSIRYYEQGTLSMWLYGPHPAEWVKGFFTLKSQDISYQTPENNILHADVDFLDHPTFLIRSRNSNASSFYFQNYHYSLGAIFATSQPVGGNTDLSFRPGRVERVVISNTAPSALSVNSTTQGFLPPRMTTAQRDLISSPANGLIIFCSDCTATDGSTGVSQTYSSSAWRNHY